MNPTFVNRPPISRALTAPEAELADSLWLDHLNTDQISKRLRIAESDVERALHRLWDADLRSACA